jgi:integrase/recombinase XerD
LPSKVSTVLAKVSEIPNEANRKLVYEFYDFMRENDTSESYQRGNLIVIICFAKFLNELGLTKVEENDQIISFLDSKKKNSTADPEKIWIRTWNDYLQRIKYFLRWLHNYKVPQDNSQKILPSSDWRTPYFVNIKPKKTRRISPYSETELWELNELLTIVKYEKYKRNKAALTLLWDLDARNHEVTLLRIKHLRLRERYGEGEIPHQSKTGTGPFLLTCSFPYVRDWLNEHPFRNEPNAMVICTLW